MGLGYLGFALFRAAQDRTNALLAVGGADLNSRGFITKTLRYIALASIPYILHRVVMENINWMASVSWGNNLERSLRLESLFPNEEGGRRLLLAAVAQSNLTVRGYAGCLAKLSRQSYRLVEVQWFTAPNLVLLPAMFAKQPLVMATALPVAVGLDFMRAHLAGKITGFIERIHRRQVHLANQRARIEQHDTRSEELIQRGGFVDLTAKEWRANARKLRMLATQRQALQTFHVYANTFVNMNVVGPGIEIVLAFLLHLRHIAMPDLRLYTKVIHDAIDLLLTRSRKEAMLSHMHTNIEQLRELLEQLEIVRARPRARCAVDAGRRDVHVTGLEFARGPAHLRIAELSLQPGIYALTGANGCGKSSFLAVLSSCARGAASMPAGLDLIALEGIALTSDDIVVLPQLPYCPLFISPLAWLLLRVPPEHHVAAREKLQKLLAELSFYQAGGSGELEAERDDWYSELSGGQRLKAEFIREVFMRDTCPDILLLDETFAALDPAARATIQAKLRAFCSHSVVLVVHHSDREQRCLVAGGFFDGNLHFANGTAALFEMCSDAPPDKPAGSNSEADVALHSTPSIGADAAVSESAVSALQS
eukprot:NODE_1744_length_2387_cov_6.468584.p1 GENE.NODE_1744_length_2387_cov_6.468584~~NODE_1744_length_2387_cov_6.468584.p1  ORF type:complete len:686 (-),score=199.43 NODE_1744_length_2387_cov_6.468584:329-2110(-)